MDTKEVKVGKKYVFELLAVAGGDKFAVFETPTGCPVIVPQEEAEALYPVKGSLGTTPAPKYDPNRKFRKGDKAKPRIINGRENQKMPLNVIFTVIGDEDEYGAVAVEYMSPSRGLLTSTTVHAVWLELLTPVEELERYILIHNKNEKYYEVCWKDDDEPDGRTGRTRCRATYWYHLPPQTYSQKEAKAAAEAECARLNAEYRKEQK